MTRDKTTVSETAYKEVAFADLWHSTLSSIRYLFKKWYWILLAGILGGLLGIFIAWLEKPRYQSRMTFALEEGGGGLSSALSLAAEFGLNIGGGKDIFEGDNIMEIFTSRHMVERVLLSADTVDGKVMTFADHLIAIGKKQAKKSSKLSRLDSISFPYGQSRESFSYLQDSVLFLMYDGIRKNDLAVFKPDKKLSIYEINFTSPDERFTKRFTERLVRETSEFYTELRSKRQRETLQILENRVAELKGSLNSAISGRTAIQDANVNPAYAAAQAPLQRKQVDITVYGGAYGELYKNLELARYQYLKSIPLLQVIDEPLYPMKRIKKGKLKTGIIYAFAIGLICCLVLLARRQYRQAMKAKIEITTV